MGEAASASVGVAFSLAVELRCEDLSGVPSLDPLLRGTGSLDVFTAAALSQRPTSWPAYLQSGAVNEIPAELWQYEEDLRRYAQYLCRHREDAEDVAHNALLKAAQHSEEFRGEASMRTWLHTILTNECRMLRRRKTPLSLDRYFEDRISDDLPPAEPPDKTPDPGELAEEAELRGHALNALSEMPEHYRAALFLQVGLRKSTEEIAQAIDRTVPATKSILYRARASMREKIAPYLEREVQSG